MKNKILSLINEIDKTLANPTEDNTLPQGTYILPSGAFLCTDRPDGDSRYPLERDGMALWAHTDGYIDAYESLFKVFRTADYNEDNTCIFFAGEKINGGKYLPISITGSNRNSLEPETIERYVVFEQRCAYYITRKENMIYYVRAHIDLSKRLRFRLGAANSGGEQKDFYLACYYEPMLRYMEYEGFFNRMTKYGHYYPEKDNAVLTTLNSNWDHLVVTYKPYSEPNEILHTVAKQDVLGRKGGCLTNATAFVNGKFANQSNAANTTDIPVFSQIISFTLAGGEHTAVDYCLEVAHGDEELEEILKAKPDFSETDIDLEKQTKAEIEAFDGLNVKFENYNGNTSAPVLNRFIKSVQKQVNLCALGKNYAGEYLGVRDVFQQLELALIWNPKACREQIVRCLDYILTDGRAPRQISFPTKTSREPKFDLRPYIDQGLWIISTMYTYLAFTGDYSILDERCSYFTVKSTYGPADYTDEKDSVLDHIVRIAEFLCSNVDPDTHCLHSLYGDWNDALDALGRTKKEGAEFGNGVSVMATLQLYDDLDKVVQILTAVDKYEDFKETALDYRAKIKSGLSQNALQKDKDGHIHIVHGWGEDQKYYVGSPEDFDGVDRISLTPHAFWAISGMANDLPDTREGVAENILSLDSKYGLLTFSKPFPFGASEVGRIATITPGTYENSCSYVHAGMFGTSALFILGRSKKAWEMLDKSMVITHPNCTLTTFVMPNSYCHNDEYGMDGESMGDWYTGSGAVLLKNIVRYGFGIQPTLDGLHIATPSYLPSRICSVTLNIRGKKITLEYKSSSRGYRQISVDGNEVHTSFDETIGAFTADISYDMLSDGTTITVRD